MDMMSIIQSSDDRNERMRIASDGNVGIGEQNLTNYMLKDQHI